MKLQIPYIMRKIRILSQMSAFCKEPVNIIARMAKYVIEEGSMQHDECVQRREEILSDSDMSEKEKRERIRAMKEVTIAKKATKIAKIVDKLK